MRFECVHLTVELPSGFARVPVEQGYEFVEAVSGDVISLAVMARDEVSAPSAGEAEALRDMREALVREKSGQRPVLERLNLESRASIARSGFCSSDAMTGTALWFGVSVHAGLVVLVDYLSEGSTPQPVAFERARQVFDSLRTDERAIEKVDPGRLYIYPLARPLLEKELEGRDEGDARCWGDFCLTVVERVDGVARFVREHDLREAGLSPFEAFLVGIDNVERDAVSGAFKLQKIAELEEPVYAVQRPWAASTLASPDYWSMVARKIGADDLTVCAIDRSTVLMQGDHPNRAIERLDPLRADITSRATMNRLPPVWFHWTAGRITVVDPAPSDGSDFLAVSSLMHHHLRQEDYAAVFALAEGRPRTPFLAMMVHYALMQSGRIDDACAYGKDALATELGAHAAELAQQQVQLMRELREWSAAEAILERDLREHPKLSCGLLLQAQRLLIDCERFDEARKLGDEAFERVRVAPVLWPLLSDVIYNAACTHARRGDREAMLEVVRYMKEHGHPALQDLAADSDLASFKDDPELRALLFGSTN